MNIFLSPASKENLNTSLSNPVNQHLLERHLSDQFLLELNAKADLEGIKCWAMTESKKSYYQEMVEGDVVLFSESGTGKFNYIGKVMATIKNRDLGNEIWSFSRDKPWEYIYFLKDIRKIDLIKENVVKNLGYDSNYVVPGLIMLDDKKKRKFIDKYEYLIRDVKSVNRKTIKEAPSNTVGEATSTYRIGHTDWAEDIKSNYNWKCAVCGIEKNDFLVAGHISPWSEDENNRLNRNNGICFCALHDVAFEKGYISLNDDYKIILNPNIDFKSKIGIQLKKYQDKKILIPDSNKPDIELLSKHRNKHGFE